MFNPRGLGLLATALCAISSTVLAAPAPQASGSSSSSGYWLANIDHSKDTVWGNSDASYPVFRNVKDSQYGAKGDGVTDDTKAIQAAISAGNRCGWGCNQSTTSPAIVYFPAGTYVVSSALLLDYYTQVVGDPTNLPIVKATSAFSGMAVFDADPYQYDAPGSPNWFTNQNNFFRQIRNFKIDLTQWATGAGIHWQVAQATSLQNIVFDMTQGGGQTGIFMDNGSGGFFSDLVFNGGAKCAFLGSQQFTTRNLTFNNCGTAIYMNWNWGWTIHGVTVNGGTVAVDMAASPTNQSVGSVVIADSTFSSQYGVNTSFTADSSNVPANGGTLIIDNVDMSRVSTSAVWSYHQGASILAPGKISAWSQGSGYVKSASPVGSRQGAISPPQKSSNLLDGNGNVFARSKPQYENVALSNVYGAKAFGCKGDGATDDTGCVNALLQKVSGIDGAIAYFEHGAYLVKNTIKVPNNVKIVGEVWSLIVADSASFSDSTKLTPVFAIGQTNDTGSVEISDILFTTNGPAPGAIMVQWNLQCAQGACGMWDSHVRVGGSAGSNLQVGQCPGLPSGQPSPQCYGVGLMFHASPQSGGVYLENTWFWVADHDMEVANQTQVSIYSPRGALFQSQAGPVWLWGTASEHSMFYNYQFDGVNGLFAGFIQSETPYFQPNPTNPGPFSYDAAYDDPTFASCSSGGGAGCAEAWGLRVLNSQGVLVYSTGLYSFFQNYDQTCVAAQNCQENMISIENSQVALFAVTTKAAVNMLIDSAVGSPILDANNRDNFGATLAYYFSS